MKRQLVRSATFIRAAKKVVKKRPQAIADISDALIVIAETPIKIQYLAFHAILQL